MVVGIVPRMYRSSEDYGRALGVNRRLESLCKIHNIRLIDPWATFFGKDDLFQRDGTLFSSHEPVFSHGSWTRGFSSLWHPSLGAWGEQGLVLRRQALQVREWPPSVLPKGSSHYGRHCASSQSSSSGNGLSPEPAYVGEFSGSWRVGLAAAQTHPLWEMGYHPF